MTNHRMDLTYFTVLLLVAGVGYLVANRESEESEAIVVPDFSLPSIDLEIPFALPHAFVRFARPDPPRLELSENMESVRVEVRSVLLESSEPIQLREEVRLAAVVE